MPVQKSYLKSISLLNDKQAFKVKGEWTYLIGMSSEYLGKEGFQEHRDV